jgi:hypothetical protein
LEENGTAANLLGISYQAASGDDGAADCGPGAGEFGGEPGLFVDSPGSFPGVTSVGGTEFPSPGWNAAGNLLAYPSVESVWNESNDPYSAYGIGAGGGGISIVFARPAYQSAIQTCQPVGQLGMPENASQFRQVPDIALSAASDTPGYFIECTPNSTGSDCSNTGGSPVGFPVGGTSCAAPTFSGIVAILNQAAGERLGNLNPLLYAVNATTPAAFHDITKGNNEIACGPAGVVGDAGGPGAAGWPDAGCGPGGLYGFAATEGYDCASGLGSIDGYYLALAVAGSGTAKTKTSLTAAPISGVEPGQDVTLTATVDVTSTSSSTADLGGAVTFTFESYTTTGATDLSWELGTVPITGASTSTATVTLKTPIPPGLVKPGQQWVDVIANYGGDATHLSSQSAKVGVGFATLDFAITPATKTLDENATTTFSLSGTYTPPVTWNVVRDTTQGGIRTDGGFEFSASAWDLDGGQSTTYMGGAAPFTVGLKPGYVEISAVDKNGVEAIAQITVTGPTGALADGGPFWASDAEVHIDSGVAPAVDAGVDAAPHIKDAGTGTTTGKDAGKDSGVTRPKDSGVATDAKKDVAVDAGTPEVSSGGCNCEVRGAHSRSGGTSPAGAVGGVLLGLSAVARRRRVNRR